NDMEKKLGTENKETEEETEKQKKKQSKKTEEEEYKKQRKQKPRASLGEHRSRLDQVTTWSKRDTDGLDLHPYQKVDEGFKPYHT
ncbi:hypothetical protein PIB30_100400, partial [Stylosanthes scabra]|nr:hypothetical protein [Stylosanthes scabra]